VIHAGLYYSRLTEGPASAESRDALRAFADERGIPYRLCGKLVVALDEMDLPRLEELKRRGFSNGLRGLTEVRADGIRELEPHATGIRALHVPETGIIDFGRVALAYADEVESRGGQIVLDARVVTIERRNGGRRLTPADGRRMEAANVVSCSRLQSGLRRLCDSPL
jgi:L-2-hydroxyglutarate oxidase LhgO